MRSCTELRVETATIYNCHVDNNLHGVHQW